MDNETELSLAQSVSRNTDLLSGRIPTTATVKAPREEFLQVELVPLSVVARLEEVGSDSGIAQGMFWTLVGGGLGVITSLILNGTALSAVDKSIWVALAALGFGAGASFYLWQRSAKRTADLKRKLFQEVSEP